MARRRRVRTIRLPAGRMLRPRSAGKADTGYAAGSRRVRRDAARGSRSGARPVRVRLDRVAHRPVFLRVSRRRLDRVCVGLRIRDRRLLRLGGLRARGRDGLFRHARESQAQRLGSATSPRRPARPVQPALRQKRAATALAPCGPHGVPRGHPARRRGRSASAFSRSILPRSSALNPNSASAFTYSLPKRNG